MKGLPLNPELPELPGLALPLIAMVTDRQRYGGDEDRVLESLVRSAQAAARAGVDLIHVREQGLTDRRLIDLVLRLRAAVADTQASVLVNERTDVALAAGVEGVHLRSTSPPASRVRDVVSKDFVIGRSVHSRGEAVLAERQGGCDYLVFGTVFPSGSKPGGHVVAGLDALKDVCASVALPVLAIGGITAQLARDAAEAGAAGIAAIELFARSETDGNLHATVGSMRAAFKPEQWRTGLHVD